MEENKPAPTIQELYPNLTDDHLREAEENLDQYLNLTLRIYDRLTSDPKTYAQFCALKAQIGTLGCTLPKVEGFSSE